MPEGYYNIERMLKGILVKKGKVKLWGSCMDARGLSKDMVVKKAERSNMEELAELTENADQVMVF